VTRLRVVERPGDPWLADPGDTWACASEAHVLEGRPPCWVIRLPGVAFVFHTNQRSTETDELWEVEGEPPDLTVRPSIDVVGFWHGHVVGGEMYP
jgi:hypothetical protein